MIKMFSQRMKNQKGFTLVELILVIAIMGVLGSIAAPNFGKIRENAAEKADKATAAVLANAAKLYYFENPGAKDIDIQTDLVDEGLLESEPKPQVDGKDSFVVQLTSDGSVTVKYNNADESDNLYPAK